jgi:GTP cyclohydrolase I
MINQTQLEKATSMFLQALGLDLKNQHFKGTPARVAKAWATEFAKGYEIDPMSFLNVEFNDSYDQIILVKDIPILSHCAHHIVPFRGTCKVGYIPDAGRITGLSKIARMAQAYAARLQIQEQLTREIADAITKVLKPKGVAVVIQAEHFCMSQRGARAAGSTTVTSYMKGCFRDEPSARAEFMAL